MKYINHHSLINFNNECVRVYMCVNIGFNECFHDTERIRAVHVFVKEFDTKILNVRVCVSVLVTMSISSGGTTCSFGDG